nr:peptidylprolyl isomerase [candidate division Zixibacteria bacterium]
MKSATKGLLFLLIAILAFGGCSSQRRVKDGDKVKVNYTGRFEDGEEFDSSRDREPLEVTIGSGDIIPGFEIGLLGMAVGETKTITITPDEAYGQVRSDLIATIPKSQFPPDMNLVAGQQLQSQQPDGRVMTVTVKEVMADSVTIDANHPMAGKTLLFDVEVVEIM